MVTAAVSKKYKRTGGPRYTETIPLLPSPPRSRTCGICNRTFTCEDVNDAGMCILCNARQHTCCYCASRAHEKSMYHIPAGHSYSFDRWICSRCWISPIAKTKSPTQVNDG